MQILIVYSSNSGNTKKVVEVVKNQLSSNGHNVVVRNALTAKPDNIDEADLVIIGTPVHGYILFGQKPAKSVRKFLETQLPLDLSGKSVIGFATYLFFPSGALKPIKTAVEERNGRLLGLFANKRSNKSDLADDITKCVITNTD
jgi:flavodoxin